MSAANRLVKNTGFLYIKMGITMFISLYSTRLILGSLGASDFGIFNVVGGAIGLLGFLNSTMANATQRFMSYAEGEGKTEKKRAIFNVCMILHFGIAIVTIFLLLAAMYPLFHGIFNIEHSRVAAATIVYLCLIFSTALTIMNVPYDAIMNAHENMLYYSIIGVFESLLKLAIAFICVYTDEDKLSMYGILMACVPLITLSIMKIYCHRKYDECVIAPKRYWDSALLRHIANFFGWNFLTAISSLFSAQGIGLVLNHFWGSVFNASQGIAQQVNGAVSTFSVNMMKALNPIITKKAGAKDVISMNRATFIGCKFSTILTIIFAIPLSLEIHYVLTIWLKAVPAWATTFVILQFVQVIIVQMAQPAATAVYAQGEIKHYAIWKSVMNFLPVLFTYFAFRNGGSPIWLYIPMIVIWAIGGDIVILYYAKVKCNLNIGDYIRKVLFPLIGTVLLMLFVGIVPVLLFRESFIRFILTCIVTTILMLISIRYFITTDDEKRAINNLWKSISKKWYSWLLHK